MVNKQLWLCGCIAAALAATLGCGGGSTNPTHPSSKPEFLYTVTATGTPLNPSFQLSSFTADASTGALNTTSSAPLPQITPGIAVRPDAKFLYLSFPGFEANAIGIDSIDSTTGVPTSAGAFLLTTICGLCAPPSGPGALTMDPTGETLYYGSDSFGGGIAEGIGALASDGSSGELSLITGSPFSANPVPFFILAHPSGQFVYTEDLSESDPTGAALQSVSGYSVDSTTGALVPVAGSPFAPPASAQAIGFVIHPSGKFLYASTGAAANGILAWSVDGTTGELAALSGSPFQPGLATYSAASDPAGKFLYVSAGKAGGVYGFSVDASTGALTPLGGSPFLASSGLGGMAVDPTGHFLFAVDGSTSAVAGFGLDDATGALTGPVSTAPINALFFFSLTIVQAP